MKIQSKFHGIIELEADADAIQALRWLAKTAPGIKVYVTTENGKRRFIIPLAQLSFDHVTLSMLNCENLA